MDSKRSGVVMLVVAVVMVVVWIVAIFYSPLWFDALTQPVRDLTAARGEGRSELNDRMILPVTAAIVAFVVWAFATIGLLVRALGRLGVIS